MKKERGGKGGGNPQVISHLVNSQLPVIAHQCCRLTRTAAVNQIASYQNRWMALVNFSLAPLKPRARLYRTLPTDLRLAPGGLC